MKKLFYILTASALLISTAAFAGTRTVEIVTATGFVQAIVMNAVTTPAPDGMTFVVVTNDSTQVQAGWTYNATNGTFSPPS